MVHEVSRRDGPRQRVDLLVLHAAELLTCRAPGVGPGVRGADLNRPELISDGAVAVDGGRIVAVGDSASLLDRYDGDRVVDASGRLVTPGLVDPHTHLVHGGTRHEQWGRSILGLPTDSLREGIGDTVRKTRGASSEQLRRDLVRRLDAMLAHGTTTVETKSGYGLSGPEERRLLEVVASVRHPVDVASTYLGAHVLPPDFTDRRGSYVDQVVGQLPEVSRLAEFCDVCCDPVGFTPDECRRIAAAARAQGLKIRVHADQNGPAGGAEFAVEVDASSVDHLEYVSDRAIAMLADSDTAAVLLPGVTFHLMDLIPTPGQPAWSGPQHSDLAVTFRRLVESGALVALATDYNPGTSPTLSMQMVMQLAARLYRLTYGEVWHLSTINAAASLGRHDRIGSIDVGKQADLVVWTVPSHELVVNQFGVNLVHTVVKEGALVHVRAEEARVSNVVTI
jgi:imidazolonepropionase